MREFWKGLIVGGDEKASMAKTMLWLVFLVWIASWFAFPNRDQRELTVVIDSLLLYVFGGKAVWRKRGPHDQT